VIASEPREPAAVGTARLRAALRAAPNRLICTPCGDGARPRIDANIRRYGRRFRVVRLERLVRTGRTSPRRHVRPIPIRSRPSWCRHSDCASKGCPMADDEDEGEEMPVELYEDARRLTQLFRQEEERRKTPPGDTLNARACCCSEASGGRCRGRRMGAFAGPGLVLR